MYLDTKSSYFARPNPPISADEARHPALGQLADQVPDDGLPPPRRPLALRRAQRLHAERKLHRAGESAIRGAKCGNIYFYNIHTRYTNILQ